MAKGDVSYSAEFVVDLDRLKAGVVNAQTMLNKLETYFVETGKRSGDSISKGLNQGLNDASAALVRAKRDAKVYGDVTGDMTGAVEKTIQAHKDYIAALIKTAQANGDAEGSIKKLIAATQQEVKALKEGRGSADGFGKGIKKGFDDAGEQAAKLGANIVKSLSPVVLAVTAGIKAIKAIGGAIKDAFMANETFKKSTEDLKSAMGASFAAAVQPVSNAFATILQKVADSIKRTNEFSKALKNLKDTAKAYSGDLDQSFSQVQQDIEIITSAIEKQQSIIESYQKSTLLDPSVLAVELEKLASAQEKLNELKNIEARLGAEIKNANSENLKAEAEYRAQLEDINVMENAMSGTKEQTAQAQQQANRERQSANEAYLRQLIEIRSRMLSAKDVDQTELGIIQQKIALQAELLKIQTEQNAPVKEESKPKSTVEADREKLRKETNSAVRQMLIYASSISDEEERQKYIEQQKLGIYDNAKKSLTGIIDQYGATRENAKKTYEYWDELVALTNEEITRERELTDIEIKMNEELAVALRQASHIEGTVEQENYLRNEQNRIYSNTRKELDEIIEKYGLTSENAEKAFEFADRLDNAVAETAGHINDSSRALELLGEIAKADLEYAQQTEAIEFKRTNNLIDEIEYANERQQAADEYNKTLATLAGKYKDVSGAADILNKKVREGAKQQFDFNGLAESLSQGVGYYQDAAGSVMSIIGSMAEDQIDIINKTLEEEQKAIDQLYEDTMAKLDEERQAALEAAGFAQSVTEEGLAASMEAAIASGDEGAIYREKRRQEELAINKKYDQLEKQAEDKKLADTKAAEDKAQRETAEIQYRQAMTDWALKLAIAPAQIASAILQGFADAGPLGGIPLAGIMAGLGALQLGAIIAAEPKKPAFKHGGIVGLPETYDTRYANGGIVRSNTPRGIDAVDTTLANREMILNDDQQSNLFNMIKMGQIPANSGGGPYALNVYLSVAQTADMIVECVNNGQTRQIEGRMIKQ